MADLFRHPPCCGPNQIGVRYDRPATRCSLAKTGGQEPHALWSAILDPRLRGGTDVLHTLIWFLECWALTSQKTTTPAKAGAQLERLQ
jgi:hypothetical protein